MVTSSKNNIELSELLIASHAGDRHAYAQFLTRITPRIQRMLAGRIATADIDDVTQEILISIHKARHTYDGKRPILPWLAAIAHFRLADHLRKHYSSGRQQTVTIHEMEEFLSDVTEPVAETESMDELLKTVPERQKQILTLMHGEGYTAKEIGKQLNMKESAVKVAAHRAIKKLRETLRP